MRKFAAALCLILAGCNTPEPIVITKVVKEAVPTPCTPDLGQRPALMTRDQVGAAIAMAPALDDQIKIVADQLLLYMGWIPAVEAGLKGCAGAPK